jgi:hypothetical protein
LGEAAEAGADLAVLPEVFPYLGPRARIDEVAEPLPDGEAGRMLAGVAAERGVWVLGGSVQERDGDRIHNTSPLFDRGGELVARYRTWPEDPASTIALWWEREVRLACEDGRALGPELYCETRYEALVADPAGESARLCAFLGVEYDEAMLGSDRPPTPGLRDWSAQMPVDDVRRFEAAAGDLLDELGYPRAFPGPDPEARDHAARMRALFTEEILAHEDRLPGRWERRLPA